MRASLSLSVLLLGAFGSGCGASDGGNGIGASSTDPAASAAAVPVSSAPLHGQVGGSPFTAKVALARFSATTRDADVEIFDTARTCADFAELRDGWRVAISVRWQTAVEGAIGDLAQQNGAPVGMSSADLIVAAFVRTTGGSVHNAYGDGRVEVIEASTTEGSLGLLRVRATSSEGHQVEGEIPVKICAVDG